MKGNYQSVKTAFEYLDETGILEPALNTLLAMLVMGAALFLSIWLYTLYKKFRIHGGLSGIRTRKKLKKLRAQDQLEGEFTFADAIELSETGTIRKKTLEDKIVNCVVPIEMLFADEDHGLIYQFEMGERSTKEVASWIEVVHALKLPQMTIIMEDVMLIHNIMTNPMYDPEYKDLGEKMGDRMRKRAATLHRMIKQIDGISQLRAACEAHLRRNAPTMLPLPTW